MGCDIHIYVEKKINGKWILAQGLVEYKGDDGKITKRVPYPDQFYNGRNYLLFGMLTGGEVRAEPGIYFHDCTKGFPDDACEEIAEIYDSWGDDAHSASWLTAKELRKINPANDKIVIEAIVSDKKWDKFVASQLIGQPNYKLVEHFKNKETKTAHKRKWKEPIKDHISGFFEKVEMIGFYDMDCDEDEIRIIFWFDN